MPAAASLRSHLRRRVRRPALAVLRILPLFTASRRLPPGVLRGWAQIALNRRTASLPVEYRDVGTRFGFRMSGNTRDFIQRYVYVFGVWEPSLSEWMAERLSPGDVVVDVGANVGYFSLLCAQSVGPAGRVIALEPVPAFAAALRADAESNGFTDVIELQEVAASDRIGTTEVYVADASNRGMSSTEPIPGYETSVTVPVVRAETCIDPACWSRVRLVKVDVEGDELRALVGMRNLLDALEAGAAVVVEVAGDRLEVRGETVEDVMAFMSDLDFQAFRIGNEYSPRSYAFHRREPLEPVVGVPQGHAEIVFIKGDRARLRCQASETSGEPGAGDG